MTFLRLCLTQNSLMSKIHLITHYTYTCRCFAQRRAKTWSKFTIDFSPTIFHPVYGSFVYEGEIEWSGFCVENSKRLSKGRIVRFLFEHSQLMPWYQRIDFFCYCYLCSDGNVYFVFFFSNFHFVSAKIRKHRNNRENRIFFDSFMCVTN